MIPIISGADVEQWLSARDARRTSENARAAELEVLVREIITCVRETGDDGLRVLGARFNDVVPDRLELTPEEIVSALNTVSKETKEIIDAAAKNIRAFAQAVKAKAQPVRIEQDEYAVGLEFSPVQRVACYVPGGAVALPSTALMTALTAQIAGVPEICIASPSLRPEIIYAGSLAGVKQFYQIGGAQAAAALAFGTESIKRVDMIVGPGTSYVAEAKRQLNGLVGIDMLAGPREAAVLADDGADPQWLALDLLAQAEHAPDASAYLLTDSERIANATRERIIESIKDLPVPPFIIESLSHSAILLLPSLARCVQVSNFLAPEHLQLQVAKPDAIKSQLVHYGCLFIGYHSTVPFGAYMAGPNHTLPTNGTARFCGSLNPFTFLRAQTWVQANASPHALASQTAKFAAVEGLHMHAAAATARAQVPQADGRKEPGARAKGKAKR